MPTFTRVFEVDSKQYKLDCKSRWLNFITRSPGDLVFKPRGRKDSKSKSKLTLMFLMLPNQSITYFTAFRNSVVWVWWPSACFGCRLRIVLLSASPGCRLCLFWNWIVLLSASPDSKLLSQLSPVLSKKPRWSFAHDCSGPKINPKQTAVMTLLITCTQSTTITWLIIVHNFKAPRGIVRETRPIIEKQIMQLAASAYSSSCHQNCGVSHHDSQMTARIMKNHE